MNNKPKFPVLALVFVFGPTLLIIIAAILSAKP